MSLCSYSKDVHLYSLDYDGPDFNRGVFFLAASDSYLLSITLLSVKYFDVLLEITCNMAGSVVTCPNYLCAHVNCMKMCPTVQ